MKKFGITLPPWLKYILLIFKHFTKSTKNDLSIKAFSDLQHRTFWVSQIIEKGKH